MESFLPSEIARLVLGYLEEAKCPDAYETFLNSCPYLEECVKMKQDGRRFRTQVLGLTLLDILYEYSAIYSLVQERLKKVDPETAESLKNSGSLLDKITFLLNATSSGQTMLFSITLPPGKSPQNSTVAHVRKRLKSTPGDRKKDPRKVAHPQISEVNTYPEMFDSRTGPAVIEATCLNSLPGNTSGTKEGILDCYEHVEDITKTPKRKAQHIRKSRSNSANVEGNDENLDLTMITKALLDNHELHEKIAENINKVIYTPDLNTTVGDPAGQDLLCEQNPVTSELNTNFCVSNNFTMELDNAFKKIVQDTESDPVFEHLLEEVIGAVSEETSDDCDDRGISDTSTPYQSTPEINKKQLLKNRLRSSKLKRSETPLTSSSEVNTPNKIDYQNAAAIESIVLMNANAEHEKSTECNVTVIENTNKEPVNMPKEIQKEPQMTVTSDTVVVSKPESNTVTVTASETKVTTVESITQPIPVINASTVGTSTTESVTSKATLPMKILPAANSNLIMVSQQNTMPTQSAIVITETFCQQPLFQDNKIIFLSNQVHGIGSQIVAVQPAQFQLSQSTVMSDSDILSMPTMIMCGDDRQSPFVPTTIATKYIGNNTPIYPKGILNEPSTSSSVPAVAKAVTKYKPKPKSKQKPTVTTSTCETDTVKFVISVQAETKPTEENVPANTVQESSNSSASIPEVVALSVPEVVAPSVPELVAPSVPMISLESNKKEETAETEKSITPTKTSDSKVQVNLSSPRNGRSHVRALDFSTPASDNWSGRKATSSPKSRGSKSKSPKSATKNVREKLFKSPIKIVNIPIATRSPMAKLVGDWDQVQGAGLILGKEKSSEKTRNALSDSDIVVQSKTKNKLMETVKKIQRPRRAVTLKSKVLQTTDEAKPTTSTENVEETMNNSNENEKENSIISTESLPLNKESTEKLTHTKRKLVSWDKDLRALVEPVAVPKKKTAVAKKSPIVKKTPKCIVKIPRKRSKRKDANTSTESTKTDVDGLSIEKELEKMEAENQVEKKEESKKNDDSKIDVKVEIIVPKKRRQTKKTRTVAQKEKNTKEIAQPEVEIEVTTQEVEFSKEASVAEENVGSGDNQEQCKEIITDNLRNMKPRYNKKCNVGSAIKKNIQESVQKYVDNNEETKCMTIMSPSKMNANKRTLVEHESNKEYVVEQKETLKVVEMASVIASAPSTSMTSEVLDVSLCKITPDISRPSTSNPITMKCNLTPVLETPMKCDSLLFPVTPKLYTPFSSTDSPFTKLFKDQPGSVDLSCIPTPNFPVTPKFIVTPNSQAGDSHSSYASRPTDYSNSSSYYQPSDSEQNQRLEQILIEEAVKHDTNVEPRSVTSPPKKESPSIQKIQSYNKNINYILEETALPCSTAEIVVAHTELVDVNTETQREPVIQEPMKLLSIETQTYEEDSGNIIEPENTSQNRSICTDQYSSDSSSTSSSSTSSSSDSDSSDEEDEKNCSANATVIHSVPEVFTEVKVVPVSERYALRSSTKSTPVPEKEKHEPDSSNDSIKFFVPKKRVSRRLTDSPLLKKTEEEESGGQNKAVKSNVTRSHKMLLKELEIKRKRVLTDLKTGELKKVNRKVVKSKKIIEENVPVAKPRKGRPRKNTTVKERISKIDSKPIRKKEKSNATLKKLTSPRKSKTIEDVATRLKEQIPELNEPLNLKVVIPVTSSSSTDKQEEAVLYRANNTSRDSSESNSDEKDRRHAYTSSVEDEEFPRLHISSDEEYPKSPDPSISEPPATRIREDPQMLVRSLKERGIHLIPKKVIDSTLEKEHLQENRAQECSIGVDRVEEIGDADKEKINKAVNNKGKKIKIRSNVILDEKIDLSKIELSQSVFTDTIRGQSSTVNVNVHNNDEQKQTSDAPLSLVQEPDKLVECIKETDKREQILSIYNSSGSTTASEDSFTYEEFNVKIVTEDSPEFIKVVHDETIKCQKKISDYNLNDLLTKTIKAKVYIEELDIDQDRHLVITPFLDLLTISHERKRRITKEANEEPVSSKAQKTCTKPLDILYNELVDDSSAEDKLKPNTEMNTEKQDIPKIKTREVPSKTKTKVIVQKQTEDTAKANESQAGSSKDNQPMTKATKKTTITLEQYKNKNSKKKIELAGGSGTDNAYRKNTEESDERVSEENEEDSLMTFAIVGKDETPTQDSNVKKRKATSSIDSSKQTNEKRIKSNDNKAMLKVMADLDLDKFLAEVHGPSSQ
ncbi:hypothetical protein CBL_04905 [Carabus blaptoides fortunei]